MADLAIGLSKKVVDGLVERVEKAIKEEKELWQTVERDSVFIKDELETMKSFLNTADRDRVRNSVVRTWVRQVRDLSYHAEDCIDGVLDLEPKRPWWALPYLPRVLPTWCRPKHRVGRALDEAVDKIKLIKSRVEEVSQRNLRYNLINTTGSRQIQQAATAMDLDLDLAKMQEGSSRLRCLLEYGACHGRLSVVSVWGAGGNLGTISIVRDAFDNPNVCRLYKYRAWVKLMHPFRPEKFLSDLIAQLLTNSGATCGADVLSKMEASSVNLAKKFKQLVKGRAYFIVLEDLSNMVEWYTIRTYLPDDENGRVIVSTQHPEIARLCIGQPQYVQELSQLLADHCVYAFFKEARIPSKNNNQGSTDVASLSAAANYWYYLPPIVGRDEDVRRLSDLISSSSQRRPPNGPHDVVTVLGPPNIGKDAVVAKVCSQLLLSSSNRLTPPFELYAWVKVSNPFHVWWFAQSLLSHLRPNSLDSADPIGACSRLLSEHRCLVVIDGLQRTEDCSDLLESELIYKHPNIFHEKEPITLPRPQRQIPPPDPKNSCIIVVTTEESVATYWTETVSAAVCNIIPIAAADESPSGHSGQQWRLDGKRNQPRDRSSPHVRNSKGGLLRKKARPRRQHCSLQQAPSSELSDAMQTTAGGSTGGCSGLKDFAQYWYQYCLTGRDEELCQLHDMIYSRGHQNNGSTCVLTVWGPPGVGGTYDVVAKVYSHYVLADPSTFELYGWVDVSSNSKPLSLEGFSQSLLSYMQPGRPVSPTTDPIKDCSNLLASHRCLVVIEGLQSLEDCWGLIDARLVYGHPNSCIILITGEESLATFWKTTTPYAVCNVKPNIQQQGQIATPGNMDGISRLFCMANCWFSKYYPINLSGRDREVCQLSRMISSSRLVVIWGPPGVGKTALVQKVYSQFVLNRLLTTKPFVLFGWVQVSNPFNLMGFCRSLLSVLRPSSPQSPDPIRDCSNLVRIHPCLVVIDGLQSMENFWELANNGFIYGHNSCIVLITTEKSVDTSMISLVPEDARFQVKPLDGKSAFKIFEQVCKQEAGRSLNLRNMSLLMEKCGGLPKVIFAVAKYLSRLPYLVTQFTAVVEDGKFIHELETNPEPEFVGLKGLLAWVDSDLKACPESLKLFIMYMLSFPQGIVVRRKRLVWRWIAEGYIKNSGICDMVTEAEKHVRELENLTMMMMQAPRGDTKTWHCGYQLGGFCGEVLVSRAVEDPLFLPLEVSALTKGKQRSLTSRGCSGRHLSIDAKWERDEFVFRSLDLSRLRSLTVTGHFKAFFINDSMKVLRVLDLEDTYMEIDCLKEIPKAFPRLRFLSLRGCEGSWEGSEGFYCLLDCLPDSIGDLRQLQTLDIRRTRITTFPSILKLRNLQCLRAGHTMKALTRGDPYIPRRMRRMCSRRSDDVASQGLTMPRGMSQLTALHTLGIVNVNTKGGEAILEELRDLKQLRKLELYGINSYNVQGLSHLQYTSLDSISLGFTEDGRDATSSSLYTSLRCLQLCDRVKLYGHVGILEVLPSDLGVTDLTLEIETSLTEDNMKRIREVSMKLDMQESRRVLRTLRLHFHRGGNLKFDANNGDFPLLEVLEITNRSYSVPLHVEFVPGELESTLKALKCVGSLEIPERGLHHLLSLKEVWVYQRIQEAMDKVLEGHPNKPAVIRFESWQYMRDG